MRVKFRQSSQTTTIQCQATCYRVCMITIPRVATHTDI